MELKEILKFMDRNKKLVFVAILFGTIVGVCIYYFIPEKYTSTGSFYITRKTQEPSEEYFTYEGYYSQQTAVAYTNTIVALLESLDVRKMALDVLQTPATESNLRKMKRFVDVTKTGPQLVTLTVKRNSSDIAEKSWDAYSESLIQTVNTTNLNGDTNLKVVKISEKPVTKPAYKSLALDIILGISGMTFFTLGYASLKEYTTTSGRKSIWS